MATENTDSWYSESFGMPVRLTRHAMDRMSERGITKDLVRDLLETGDRKYKDPHRIWISKAYPERDDNLICAAVVLETEIVVKTVMHRWQLVEDEQ